MMKNWTCLLIACLWLVGCATSAPVNYYTLLSPTANPASEEKPQNATVAPFLLQLLPVGIPAQMDQPQLVVRHGISGMTLLEGERWLAPLAEELRGALSAQLASQLRTTDVYGLAPPNDKPVVRIKLQVRRFDAWPGQSFQMDADWSLGLVGDPHNRRLLCHQHVREAVTGGYAELVQGQQKAINRLAIEIADTARRWIASDKALCSATSK